MLDPKKVRAEFSWFKKHQNVIYFDNGATSLKPDCVVSAVAEYYQNFSTNPHNSDSNFANSLNARIYKCRENVARFINASTEEIIFTSGATESLNLFAFGLTHLISKNDEIIVPEIEHTSNLLPWLVLSKKTGCKLITIKEDKNLDWTKALLSKISSRTKIVSFASVSNLFGTSVSSKIIAKKIKKINPNIIVVVDGTQEIQHHKINLKQSGIDLFCFSGHKMFGPTGIGVAYISQRMQPTLEPLKYGGSMSLDFDIDKKTITYRHNYEKYEGGTQNVAGILGLHAAIDFVNRLGIENINKYEKELVQYLIKKLKTIKNLELINPKPTSPVVSFLIKGINPQDVAYYLGTKNIIVRSGVSCVDLVKQRKKTQSGFVRLSLSIYNRYTEIDRLITCLKQLKIGDVLVGLI